MSGMPDDEQRAERRWSGIPLAARAINDEGCMNVERGSVSTRPVTLVPATLPPEPPGKTRELHGWYMSAALYDRLDATRARRYPHSGTREFALWLLETALDNYEQAERDAVARERVIVTPDEALHARRLIDFPPPHRVIVRD